MSRLIKIGLASVVALGIVSLGYFLREKEAPLSPADSNKGTLGGTTSLTGGAPSQNETLGDRTSIFNEELINYLAGEGELVGVNKDGNIFVRRNDQIENISSSSFASVVGAYFSFDGKRVLLEMGPRSPHFYKVFDMDKKSWKDLPPMNSPAWSPKTHELVYLDKKASGHTINILNVDSPAPKGKVSLRANVEDAVLSWPKTTFFLLGSRSSAYSASSLWRIDKDKKTWLPIVVDRSGLSLRWNEDGSTALVLISSGRGGKLNLINDRGEALRELNFLTLPEKCSFASRVLICAIPEDKRKLETSFLPDDYLKEAFFTKDSFLEVDLDSGETKTLSWGGEADAANIQIKKDEFFFLNRLDGKLYSIKR